MYNFLLEKVDNTDMCFISFNIEKNFLKEEIMDNFSR